MFDIYVLFPDLLAFELNLAPIGPRLSQGFVKSNPGCCIDRRFTGGSGTFLYLVFAFDVHYTTICCVTPKVV
jgi:hypothetical protein